MLSLKLAFKNLLGAGLRTWLNVLALSFAFVLIIFYNGLIDGWNRQALRDTIDWETGQGQFWHPDYDRLDPYTIEDSHNHLSDEVRTEIENNNLTPVLITQATAYPQGRAIGVVLKGVDPDQTILNLPTSSLPASDGIYYAIIGRGMAKTGNLNKGDNLLIRWRDKNGTFDAREIQIADIFKADVPSVDNGQIYIDINILQEMTGMDNEASLLVSGENFQQRDLEGWDFKTNEYLLDDISKIIESKKFSGAIMQGLLLIIALIAIFDTQVLSIFRRQKEIGTYIALGLTRAQVVGIFTVEGGAHSILAILLGSAYGIPFLLWLNNHGINFGYAADMDFDLPLAETIFPYYSIRLLIVTVAIVVIAATIVSYLPARKISKMKPTEALKGKLQ
ncbi:MAG: FtsX-like permease family protein [Bacteroidales bacterium]|nr:FtsX-like permease family protein [Bacteroidales bacterium]